MWTPLNFIQDGPITELTQKPPGIGAGEVILVRVLEGYKGLVGKNMSCQRGFAGLPRAREENNGKPLEQGSNGFFRLPWDVSVFAHLQSDCKLAH